MNPLRSPLVALAVLLTASVGHAAPHAPAHGHSAGKGGKKGHGPAIPWERPADPLPFLPRIARVRVDVARDTVLETIDVALPQEGPVKGDRKYWISFGSPGVPRSFDAHLLASTSASTPVDADWAANGDELPFEAHPTRPRSANALLGPDRTAGLVIVVKEAPFAAALARGGVPTLRLRALLGAPEVDSTGHQGVVVRLGTESDAYTLSAVDVAGRAGARIVDAEAHVCVTPAPSRDGAPTNEGPPPAPSPPLLLPGSPPKTPTEARSVILPSEAARRPFDALCVRFKAEPLPSK